MRLSSTSFLLLVASLVMGGFATSADAVGLSRCGNGRLVRSCGGPRLVRPPVQGGRFVQPGGFVQQVLPGGQVVLVPQQTNAFVQPQFFQQPTFFNNFNGATNFVNQAAVVDPNSAAVISNSGTTAAGIPGSFVNIFGRNAFGQLVNLVQPTGFSNLFLGTDGSLHTVINNQVCNITIQSVQFSNGALGEQHQACGFSLDPDRLQQITTFYCATPDRTVQSGLRTGALMTALAIQPSLSGREDCAKKIGDATARLTDANLAANVKQFIAARAPDDLKTTAFKELGLAPTGQQGTAVAREVRLQDVDGKPNLKRDVDRNGNVVSYYGKDAEGFTQRLVVDAASHDVKGQDGTAVDPETRKQIIGLYCNNFDRSTGNNERIDFLMHQITQWKDQAAQTECLKKLGEKIKSLPEARQKELEPIIAGAPSFSSNIVRNWTATPPLPTIGPEIELEGKKIFAVKPNGEKMQISDDNGVLQVNDQLALKDFAPEQFPKAHNKLTAYLCANMDVTVQNKNNTGFMLKHLSEWAEANPQAAEKAGNCLATYLTKVEELAKAGGNSLELANKNKKWVDEWQKTFGDERIQLGAAKLLGLPLPKGNVPPPPKPGLPAPLDGGENSHKDAHGGGGSGGATEPRAKAEGEYFAELTKIPGKIEGEDKPPAEQSQETKDMIWMRDQVVPKCISCHKAGKESTLMRFQKTADGGYVMGFTNRGAKGPLLADEMIGHLLQTKTGETQPNYVRMLEENGLKPEAFDRWLEAAGLVFRR